MKTKNEDRILNVLLISLLSMLLPMILATRVLSSTYLSILYMIGYTFQFAVYLLAIFTVPIRIRRNSVWMLIVYIAVLLLPILNDIVQGVPINLFDPINSVIKVINFFIFYVIVESIAIKEDALYRFMRSITILSIAACLYSIVFEFDKFLSIRSIANTNLLQIRSFFSNRNQYSAFLVIALAASFYCYQLKKQNRNIWVFLLQVICVLSTFSRAALFSSIIMVSLLVLQEKNAKKKTIILYLALAVGVGVVFTTEIFDYFVRNYIRWEDSGDSGRFTLWRYAWEIAKDNILTGVGFYTGVDIAVSRGMRLTQFHNMLFDLLVDGGVFEVLFIIVMFFNIYKRCSRRCSNRQLLSVCRGSFAAFIFYACFESVSVLALSYSDTMYSIFYISIPLLLSNIKHAEGEEA